MPLPPADSSGQSTPARKLLATVSAVHLRQGAKQTKQTDLQKKPNKPNKLAWDCRLGICRICSWWSICCICCCCIWCCCIKCSCCFLGGLSFWANFKLLWSKIIVAISLSWKYAVAWVEDRSLCSKIIITSIIQESLEQVMTEDSNWMEHVLEACGAFLLKQRSHSKTWEMGSPSEPHAWYMACVKCKEHTMQHGIKHEFPNARQHWLVTATVMSEIPKCVRMSGNDSAINQNSVPAKNIQKSSNVPRSKRSNWWLYAHPH